MNFAELETKITKLQNKYGKSPSLELKAALDQARVNFNNYKRQLKSRVAELEKTNTSYLIAYRSTKNYYKFIDNSALFYAFDISNRIGRRFTLNNDTDSYARSEVGVISIKALDRLESQLNDVKIFRNKTKSTDEIIHFEIPKPYKFEQIQNFHTRAKEDLTRSIQVIVPKNPIPELFTTIRDLNERIYHTFKRISEPLAREAYVIPILKTAKEILTSYTNYASASESISYVSPTTKAGRPAKTKYTPTTPQAHNLFNLLQNNRSVRDGISHLALLRLVDPVLLDQILDLSTNIERMTRAEYKRQLEKDAKKSYSEHTPGSDPCQK
ncbi:MAG: hypothetical protein Q4B29_02715 [Candidatus Saccharibacteria bacterium]|nr:hypothetical protein [Candidatus Saccharibacteria bacterium]